MPRHTATPEWHSTRAVARVRRERLLEAGGPLLQEEARGAWETPLPAGEGHLYMLRLPGLQYLKQTALPLGSIWDVPLSS